MPVLLFIFLISPGVLCHLVVHLTANRAKLAKAKILLKTLRLHFMSILNLDLRTETRVKETDFY